MRGGGVSKWVFLNSAVWYIVSLGFLFYRSFANAQDDRNTLRMTRACSGWNLNHADTTNIPSLKVQNHERRYKKSSFCVPTVPKTGQNVWIPIASVRILADFRTDAMLKNLSTLQCMRFSGFPIKRNNNCYSYRRIPDTLLAQDSDRPL